MPLAGGALPRMAGLIRPLLSPILAVLIAVAVGAILVAGVGQNPI